MFALVGSKAIAVTAMLSQKSFTACHEVALLVILVLYHNPPVTLPAHTLLVDEGSQAKALVLPPTLLGPLSAHGDPGFPGAVDCKFCCIFFVIAKIGDSFSLSGLPMAGFIVSK